MRTFFKRMHFFRHPGFGGLRLYMCAQCTPSGGPVAAAAAAVGQRESHPHWYGLETSVAGDHPLCDGGLGTGQQFPADRDS